MTKEVHSSSNQIKDSVQKPPPQIASNPKDVPRTTVSKTDPNPNFRKRKPELKSATKCISCLKVFVNLKLHISKSFTCQNMYKIDDKVEDSFERDTQVNVFEEPPTKVSKGTETKPKISCAGCSKSFVYIWTHLKRATLCQKHYDMVEIEQNHKEMLKVKDAEKHRK